MITYCGGERKSYNILAISELQTLVKASAKYFKYKKEYV